MIAVNKMLTKAGHIMTARWVQGGEDGLSREQIATLDFDDVKKADMVLVFTDPYGSLHKGGGRHTELGLGYALKKRIWLVGELEQVFHSLPGVKRFDTVDEVVKALSVLDLPDYMKEEKVFRSTLTQRDILDPRIWNSDQTVTKTL